MTKILENFFLFSYSGSEKCLEVLCKRYGSDIVQLRDGRRRTPLHVAASHGHADCVAFLLKEGANTNFLDDEGRSPLIIAAQNGQSSVVGVCSFFCNCLRNAILVLKTKSGMMS